MISVVAFGIGGVECLSGTSAATDFTCVSTLSSSSSSSNEPVLRMFIASRVFKLAEMVLFAVVEEVLNKGAFGACVGGIGDEGDARTERMEVEAPESNVDARLCTFPPC